MLAGVSGGLGVRPRMVVSGVNRGPNTGLAILHSGTVGAALTAGNLGFPALAISIDSTAPVHLDTAATVAASAMDWLLQAPAGTVLNVNVPDLPFDQVRGVREAPLARFGTVEATMRTIGHDDGATPCSSASASARGAAPPTAAPMRPCWRPASSP